MKKFIIFLIGVVVIVCCMSYWYIINQNNERMVIQQNELFESYYQKQVYGAEIATAINKAMDSNHRNHIEKDEQNLYIENDTNSIKIQIKMLDTDTIYPMEAFANNGIQNFIEYYNMIEFKCVDIQYHPTTHLVKSLLFEQVTV